LVNKYLALMLMADPIIRRLSSQARATAGQFNISLTMCRTLRIPVPPVAVQEHILADVESRLATADRTATEIDVQLARAARLRQSILKRAFEGKLVPQDPNDEPASELLARVSAASSATVPPAARSRGTRTRTTTRRGRT
jgi:type I restriction enzyme S subunit